MADIYHHDANSFKLISLLRGGNITSPMYCILPKAVARKCSVKKVPCKISRKSKEKLDSPWQIFSCKFRKLLCRATEGGCFYIIIAYYILQIGVGNN